MEYHCSLLVNRKQLSETDWCEIKRLFTTLSVILALLRCSHTQQFVFTGGLNYPLPMVHIYNFSSFRKKKITTWKAENKFQMQDDLFKEVDIFKFFCLWSMNCNFECNYFSLRSYLQI